MSSDTHPQELHVHNIETDPVEDKGKVYMLQIGEKKDHFKAKTPNEAVFCLISLSSQIPDPLSLFAMEEGEEKLLFTSDDVKKESTYIRKQDTKTQKYLSNAIGCLIKAKGVNHE